jgi:hypothetical protein
LVLLAQPPFIMPTIQTIRPRRQNVRSVYASPVRADNKEKKTVLKKKKIEAKTAVKKGTLKTPPKSPAAEKKNGSKKKNQGSAKQQSAGSQKDTDVSNKFATCD